MIRSSLDKNTGQGLHSSRNANQAYSEIESLLVWAELTQLRNQIVQLHYLWLLYIYIMVCCCCCFVPSWPDKEEIGGVAVKDKLPFIKFFFFCYNFVVVFYTCLSLLCQNRRSNILFVSHIFLLQQFY